MNAVRNILILCLFITGTGCSTLGVNKTSDDASSMVLAADAAYQAGQWATAEKHYRAVSVRVPNDAYAHFKLGNTLIQLQRWDEAITAFRAALAVDPTYAKAANNLATVHLMFAERALHLAIDQMKHNDPRAALLMMREKKIHEVVDIPVDENRAAGKHIRYETK